MVDTPGMADTAGLKQDQQNFKHTLRYISTLKELNGIAILIDANLSRLTPAFKYCIGQLLTQLHKDAAKNIVFVFTKCGQRRDPGKLQSCTDL
jgi:GTP-binding protein EngB required for normal cell division